MKNFLFVLFTLATTTLLAQSKIGPTALAIHTNAVCDMCKETIETELLYEKGVKAVELDLEKNLIYVEVDHKKTNVEKIRTAITKLGYAADSMVPDKAARENLPDCCKKEGCGLPAPQAAPEEKH
ncbi:MAG: heavy-metal-associated domain-containing protein [Flavobacteriales bacterium]|nr:heavy-metal-associated domain-containing protein [Flavobacteriales bacterium]